VTYSETDKALQDTMEQHASDLVREAASLAFKEGRMIITPALAQVVLDVMNYDRQRPTYAHHVALIADLIFRRKWTAGSQIAFGRLAGRLHLINGQHRMRGVIQANVPIEVQVIIHDVRSEDELAALYYRFDVVSRQRSNREVLNAVGVAEKQGVTHATAEAVYAASAMLANGLSMQSYQHNHKHRSVDHRLDLAAEWWPAARVAEAALSKAAPVMRRRILAASVFGPMLATMRYAQTEAMEFWRGVAENDGLRRGDARWLLVNALVEASERGGGSRRTAQCALAWNAWYETRKLSILKVPQNYVLRLAGTPYTGKGA